MIVSTILNEFCDNIKYSFEWIFNILQHKVLFAINPLTVLSTDRDEFPDIIKYCLKWIL